MSSHRRQENPAAGGRVSASIKISQLIRAASAEERPSKTVSYVHQIQEILRRHPEETGGCLQQIKSVYDHPSSSQRPDVPISILRIVEEIVCRSKFADEDIPKIIPICTQLILRCLQSNLIDVIKRSLRSFCSFFPLAAKWIWTKPSYQHSKNAWSDLQQAKLKAFSHMINPNKGVQEYAIRFLHRLIIYQTPASKYSLNVGGPQLSTDVITPNHHVVNPQELQTESVALLQKLQQSILTPEFSGGPILAHLNCLITLSRARSQLLGLILQPIVQLAVNPPSNSNWSPIVTNSVRRTIKTILISLLRIPSISSDDTVLIEDTLQSLGVGSTELNYIRKKDAKRSNDDELQSSSKRQKIIPSSSSATSINSMAGSSNLNNPPSAVQAQILSLLANGLPNFAKKSSSIPDSLSNESAEQRKELSKRVIKEIPLSVLTAQAAAEIVVGTLSKISGSYLAKSISNFAIENNIDFDSACLLPIQDDDAGEDIDISGTAAIKEDKFVQNNKEFYDYATYDDDENNENDGFGNVTKDESNLKDENEDEDEDLNAMDVDIKDAENKELVKSSENITDNNETTLESIIEEIEDIELTKEEKQQMALDSFKRILYSEPNIDDRVLYDTWSFTVCKLASGFLSIGKDVLCDWIVENLDGDRWSLAKLWLLHIYTHEIKLKQLIKRVEMEKKKEKDILKLLPELIITEDELEDRSINRIYPLDSQQIKQEALENGNSDNKKIVKIKSEPLTLDIDIKEIKTDKLLNYEIEIGRLKSKIKENTNKTEEEIDSLFKDLPDAVIISLDEE